ncbi:beta-ketoacyl synthase chain length factor [Chromohalobacter beijerinckii]|uniref:Beta-ketoacyl synthase chain length factor n=1 Tax=Chromohalobacter beijerinckii TaxID=86179 RepID=A0ABV8XH18_9GAMM|nr:beta-ketoacyl synthase chain length factor [Chromohalobacter beijerinckii]MCK0764933.1 beta-ketoacyl synthase chain length factor [Chromohalobacter beijerinckii]
MSSSLQIESWYAWSAAPVSCAGDERHDIASLSDLEPLPPLLRRRLDQAGRATCQILRRLDPEAACPIVHASRHGNTSLTWGLLTELNDGNPLSPGRFSMSVHNAVLGLHAIARDHRQPLQALAACGDELDALFDEALGYLAEGYPAVIAVFSESALPEAYQGLTSHPAAPCVVGMRLAASPDQSIADRPFAHTLSLLFGDNAQPTPLDVIAWLNDLDDQQRLERGNACQ